MDDRKKVVRYRSIAFSNNVEIGLMNIFDSPVFNILKYAMCFGIMREVLGLILGTIMYTKKQWSDLVWIKAW